MSIESRLARVATAVLRPGDHVVFQNDYLDPLKEGYIFQESEPITGGRLLVLSREEGHVIREVRVRNGVSETTGITKVRVTPTDKKNV